jgi:hypothetical protein
VGVGGGSMAIIPFCQRLLDDLRGGTAFPSIWQRGRPSRHTLAHARTQHPPPHRSPPISLQEGEPAQKYGGRVNGHYPPQQPDSIIIPAYQPQYAGGVAYPSAPPHSAPSTPPHSAMYYPPNHSNGLYPPNVYSTHSVV